MAKIPMALGTSTKEAVPDNIKNGTNLKASKPKSPSNNLQSAITGLRAPLVNTASTPAGMQSAITGLHAKRK